VVENVLIKERPGELGESAIIVGDPDRVLLLSQLLDETVVKTGARGYLYATGVYGGRRITIATHGIGSASASIVIEELHRLGVKTIVRLGTAGALRSDISVGDVILAASAVCRVGGCSTSMYITGLTPPASPCPLLTAAIHRELVESGLRTWIAPVFTSDALHAESERLVSELASYNIAGVDMETAILFTLSWLRRFRSASVLVVSNNIARGDITILDTSRLGEVFRLAAISILRALSRL